MPRWSQAEADITGTRIIDDTIGRADIGSIKFGIYKTACASGKMTIPTGISNLSGLLITHEHSSERTGVVLTSLAGSSQILNFSAGAVLSSHTATVNWAAFGTL